MAKREKRPGESIDAMLRKFRRQVKTDGVLQEVRQRERFTKPSDQKKLDFKAAQKRTRQQQKEDEL